MRMSEKEMKPRWTMQSAQTELGQMFASLEYFLHIKRLVSLFTAQSQLLTPLEKKAFENIVGKGENAGNKHFLLFPQCFLLFPKQTPIFESDLIRHLEML